MNTTTRFPYHIVFAANEMTSNISPVLDERLGVKKVWIAFTPCMLDSAERLESIYQQHELAFERIALSNAFDAKSLVTELKAATADFDLSKLAINISCGSRISSVAAVKAFENTAAGIYYLLPNDELAWLQPENQAGFNIADNLKLEEFLKAHGVENVRVTQFSQHEAHFANQLINAVDKIFLSSNSYKTFHYFATRFHSKKPISFSRLDDGRHQINDVKSALKGVKTNKLVGFIYKLLNQKLIRVRTKNKGALVVLDDHPNWQRLIVGGGWLEYWVYRTLKQLQTEIPQLQDVAYGVEVQKGDTADEIDVVFLANNQLFIIECKTGGFTSTNHNLHRLESLRYRLGGELSYAMYVTTQEIPSQGGNRDKAKRMQIELVDQSQLMTLKQQLKTWIMSKL